MIQSRLVVGVPLVLVALCGVDLAGRSIARASWLAGIGLALAPSSVLVIAFIATAGVAVAP
jgi:hypothetical protein